MITINDNRRLDMSGLAAEAVDDLILLTKGEGRHPDAIKLALSVAACTGSRITFTTQHWLRHFKHLFGDYFADRGINLSAPESGIKPAHYDQKYAQDVANYSGGKWGK